MVLDVSDPTNPTVVGSIVDDGNTLLRTPSRVFVQGNYAYVTSFGEHGVQVIDISIPTTPTAVGSIADGTNGADVLRGHKGYFCSRKLCLCSFEYRWWSAGIRYIRPNKHKRSRFDKKY